MKFFGIETEKVEWNKIEFVYVDFEPYVPLVFEDGIWDPNYLGVFRWGAKGVGFGEVCVYRIDSEGSKYYFDTEQMSKNFVEQMLAYWVKEAFTDRENPDVKPDFFREFVKENENASTDEEIKAN